VPAGLHIRCTGIVGAVRCTPSPGIAAGSSISSSRCLPYPAIIASFSPNSRMAVELVVKARFDLLARNSLELYLCHDRLGLSANELLLKRRTLCCRSILGLKLSNLLIKLLIPCS
jgi:hypothetical protein